MARGPTQSGRCAAPGFPVPQIMHLFAFKTERTKHLAGVHAGCDARLVAPLRGPARADPAFTSRRNDCPFESDRTRVAAELLGNRALVDAVLEDYAPRRSTTRRTRCVAFIEKMNAQSNQIRREDVIGFKAAGWSDERLRRHHRLRAVQVLQRLDRRHRRPRPARRRLRDEREAHAARATADDEPRPPLTLATGLAGVRPQPAPFHLLEATIDRGAGGARRRNTSPVAALVEQYISASRRRQVGPAPQCRPDNQPPRPADAERPRRGVRGRPGPVGPLHCVPVLVKDQIETSDMPTTYGSAVFKDFIPQRDATIVTKLKKAGAIIIAKTDDGRVRVRLSGVRVRCLRNAYDPTPPRAGSSGGTESGVAATSPSSASARHRRIIGDPPREQPGGIAADAAARQRFGMRPARRDRSLGPITRSVKDAAMLLDVHRGYDANDPVTAYAVDRPIVVHARPFQATA